MKISKEEFERYGKMLKKKRNEKKLLQADAAQLAGMRHAAQYWSRYESGGCGQSVKKRRMLDKAVDITRDDYIDAGIEHIWFMTYGKTSSEVGFSQAMLESIMRAGNSKDMVSDLKLLMTLESVAGFPFDIELCLLLLHKRKRVGADK